MDLIRFAGVECWTLVFGPVWNGESYWFDWFGIMDLGWSCGPMVDFLWTVEWVCGMDAVFCFMTTN